MNQQLHALSYRVFPSFPSFLASEGRLVPPTAQVYEAVMKKIMLLVVLGVGLIGVVAAADTAPSPKATNPKWEYRVERYTPDTLTNKAAQLNNLGQDGWELVSVEEQQSNGSNVSYGLYYLKRQITP